MRKRGIKMKLDIFYKKRYLEMKRKYQNLLELKDALLENLERKYIDATNRDREWQKDLLFEKAELEAKIKKLEERTKKAEEISECFRLDNEVYMKDNIELSQENATLKGTKAMLRASLGGTTKQNNKLLQELGVMKLKLELMEKRMKEYKLPAPTMEELYEYERTHKSPRKRKERRN